MYPCIVFWILFLSFFFFIIFSSTTYFVRYFSLFFFFHVNFFHFSFFFFFFFFCSTSGYDKGSHGEIRQAMHNVAAFSRVLKRNGGGKKASTSFSFFLSRFVIDVPERDPSFLLFFDEWSLNGFFSLIEINDNDDGCWRGSILIPISFLNDDYSTNFPFSFLIFLASGFAIGRKLDTWIGRDEMRLGWFDVVCLPIHIRIIDNFYWLFWNIIASFSNLRNIVNLLLLNR